MEIRYVGLILPLILLSLFSKAISWLRSALLFINSLSSAWFQNGVSFGMYIHFRKRQVTREVSDVQMLRSTERSSCR